MRNPSVLFLLLGGILAACSPLDEPPSGGDRRRPDAGAPPVVTDTLETPAPEPPAPEPDIVLFYSAVRFPDGYDWQRDSAFGAVACTLRLYRGVKPVVEMGDALLARDGCLNFFAGPTDPNFSAMFNFYNVHYGATHIVGTSGGNTDDMRESIALMASGKINPAGMITHIGGLGACADATMNLPKLKGAKKLIYTHVDLPLTAIEDFGKVAEENPGTEYGRLFADLDAICKRNEKALA